MAAKQATREIPVVVFEDEFSQLEAAGADAPMPEPGDLAPGRGPVIRASRRLIGA